MTAPPPTHREDSIVNIITILAPLHLLVVVRIPSLHYSDDQLCRYHRTRGGQHAIA